MTKSLREQDKVVSDEAKKRGWELVGHTEGKGSHVAFVLRKNGKTVRVFCGSAAKMAPSRKKQIRQKVRRAILST